ncbi:hypothetical protein [Christiangramia aquimixticola]|uniref:hypothetical protein n=1 Tax=Christiangramia aquimixticola TaxID=1697558 RepID=UPI003AA912B5
MEEKKFEDIFDEYNYTERLENSLQNYLNWLLGISIGLGAVTFSAMDNLNDNYLYSILTFIFILFGILFNGIVKFLIHRREIKMNIAFGELKKIKILREANKEIRKTGNNLEDVKKWEKSFSKYTLENNKIIYIAKLINLSSIITFFNVINTGVFITYLFIISCLY